jgi:hypothetical protein
MESVSVYGLDAYDTKFIGPGLVVLGLLILGGGWIVLASSRLLQGGNVERPERVPQLYGYTVCLVSLVWALASALAVLDAGLTLSSPLTASQFPYQDDGISVASFESFRVTYERSRIMGPYMTGQVKLDTIPEPELRRRYEGFRTERIANNRARAVRSLVKSLASLVLALVVFGWHWRWVRRKTEAAA